jgi:glycosyltransferase involved in cell wall biosynthesis
VPPGEPAAPASTGPRAIVLVVPDYLPSLGGTTTQTRLHAAEFARRGWDVTVLTRRVRGGGPNVVDGVPVRRVGPPGRSRVIKAPMLVCLWWWLFRRRRSIDVVSVIMDVDFTVCSVFAGLGRATVHTWVTRGDASRALTGRKAGIRRSALQRSRQVVLSEPMRAELTDLGLAEAAVIAVPVDSARYRPPSAAERAAARSSLGLGEGLVVVSVSHLQERKGTDRLLAAADLLQGRGVAFTLLLVGGPVESEDVFYVERLKEFVSDRSLSGSVRFEGPKADVLPYLFAADLFCLASHREGMPNVLLEAMACGVPCVAPPSAGGDVLLGAGVGVIPHSNEPDALAGALESLLADSAARDRAQRRALEAVRRSHSIGQVIDQYEALAVPRRPVPGSAGGDSGRPDSGRRKTRAGVPEPEGP